MDWRIIAAAVAALGVLTSGSLLAAQVQSDLDAGVERRIGDMGFERPDESPPFKLNEFKLPKDVPLELPPGTMVSPDLSKLTLPEDMDLQLPSDLDLSGLAFDLPEDFDLKLPAGTQFSPPGLTLPEGGSFKLPDGRSFDLPPGSKLSLPPELIDRLLAQGLPAGTLPSTREFHIEDLPPGLGAILDPPQFDGPGNLRLPAGTVIQLPDGQRVPFPPGALAYAARHLLPAGTSFDIPFDAVEGRGGEFPVPTPRSRTQLERPDTAPAAVAVDTEITSMPARVRKGDPVTVSGYVRERASTRPIAGAPVDIFMNESKRAPGVLVGQGVSDARGSFTITITLPTDKPAREYQLVNHAVAFVDAKGRAFADGWGDPPFVTYASTTLTLDVPARDGLGAVTPIAGTLKDHEGAPVAGVTVIVSVDNAVVGRATTDATGRFRFGHTFTAGPHAIEARSTGTNSYEASPIARATITIDEYALETASTLWSQPGGSVVLTGRVLGKGAVAPERVVNVDGLFGEPTIRLVSDSAGRFHYAYATPQTLKAGSYVLTYTVPDFNVTKRQTIEVNQTGVMTMSLPTLWDVDVPLETTLFLRTPQGQPIAGQPLRVALSGPGGAREYPAITGPAGDAPLRLIPLRATPGTYFVSASVEGGPNLVVPALGRTLTLGAFEVEWDLPETVVRGQSIAGTATLRFADKPLANAPVKLASWRPQDHVTDANGRVSFTLDVPALTPLGTHPLAIHAPDKAERSAPIRVVALPKLTLDAPDAFERGAPVPASLRLTDDRGAPLSDTEVTITTTSADAIERTIVRTDQDGRWSGALNVTTSGGNVTMNARVDPADPYLGADGVHTMSAEVPAPLAARGLPWPYLLVGLATIGAGAGTWFLLRKRPLRAKPAPVEAPAPVIAPLASTDVELRFAIPDGEPAVWGVGEPLGLTLRNLGASAEFDLAWPGGATSVGLAANTQTKTTLTFPEEGEVTLAATRRDGAFAPTSASVRIVDYRKETAREFDLFLEKARDLDASLTRQSTPREIVWTLSGRLGGDAEGPLEEIAGVMEITNYSHYPISRDHYLRFVRASRALDHFFAPRATPEA